MTLFLKLTRSSQAYVANSKCSGFLVDDFQAKWVKPFYFPDLRRADLELLKEAVIQIDASVVERLFQSFNWREQIMASRYCGLKRWSQYDDVIGKYLLASSRTYAGKGHVFALARFASDNSVALLSQYLDLYLTQPDKYYDQGDALAALMWIDYKRGTTYAISYLGHGGLWDSFVANKKSGWKIDAICAKFFDTMRYCEDHFDV